MLLFYQSSLIIQSSTHQVTSFEDFKSHQIIFFRCDDENDRKQKGKSWVYTYKEKWNETGNTRRKLQRYNFQACERCVSNLDSNPEFDTIFEQCESEKAKKVKIKENGCRKSHQT